MSRLVCCLFAIFLCSTLTVAAWAQSNAAQAGESDQCSDLDGHVLPCPPEVNSEPPVRSPHRSSALPAAKDFISDQKAFWTSPGKLREKDLKWLLPFASATVGLVASDTAIESHLPDSATLINRSRNLSDGGVAALAATAGGLYLTGWIGGNEHRREAGWLSGEAFVNSLIVSEAFKFAGGRERPLEGGGRGRFLQGSDSFVSEHAAAAWSVATVLANEYPHPVAQLFAYGAAAGVSTARLAGREHFASDVVIGSLIGWYMGKQVLYSHRSADERGSYGTFSRGADSVRQPDNMGSPYVPLDNWVYAGFDRLIALGYIQSGFAGLRPWTRMECARLTREAGEQLEADDSPSEPRRTYRALKQEFGPELTLVDGGRNMGAQIESVYTRLALISGQPLTDGYHFGQTIINDYGRPYARGFNNVTGISGSAMAGPLTVYIRGEYQHAPTGPALPLLARQTIARIDLLPPVPPDTGTASADQFRLLDAYVGLNLENWQFSFGKQSLWWGPGVAGPMMLSDNAEPIRMFRINRVTPFKLPSILGKLGAIRTESFLGQLSGYEFVKSPTGLVGQFGHSLDPQPFIHGEKISFKPTPDFEFGIFRTTIYGGPGYPLTTHTFLRSLFSTGNEVAGAVNKPGDRRSGLDFSYRLPGLRKWLTFYGDGFTEDEFSPIAYPDRSVWHAGLYLSHFPRLAKLDLRAEGAYSDNPLGGALGPGYYYFNGTWRNGYTNSGNLIGSWIGRAGQGGQAWTTYHFDPKNFVQLNFREQKVSQQFIPGGGTITDVGMNAELWVHSALSLSGVVQYEKWTLPVLAPSPQSNLSTSVQVTFWPRRRSPAQITP